MRKPFDKPQVTDSSLSSRYVLHPHRIGFDLDQALTIWNRLDNEGERQIPPIECPNERAPRLHRGDAP